MLISNAIFSTAVQIDRISFSLVCFRKKLKKNYNMQMFLVHKKCFEKAEIKHFATN